MKNLEGKVAAITGAGSGIGRATAILLAKKGCNVAISDINGKGLEETAKSCLEHGVKVSTHRLDVANKQDFYDWAEKVVQEFGSVNIIINNAGVALGATVESMQYEDFEWLMGINFWGVVYGTKAFLPHLKASGEGHIVNISSLFGLVGVPTQSAYNAAKFGVRGFTESLIQELTLEKSCVSATSVHPGGIKTNIAKAARVTETPGVVDKKSTADFEKMFITPPSKAAEQIVNAINKKQRRLVIGIDAKILSFIQRVMPVRYQALLVRGMKGQQRRSMKRA